MDLIVTHHAFERMGLVRLNLLSFVPPKIWASLNSPAVRDLRKVLKVILTGIAHSRRAMLPHAVEAFKEAKYGLGDVWMYDPTQGNLYTFRDNAPGYGTNLVTVTHLEKSKRKLLEDYPADHDVDRFSLKKITALRVPYELVPLTPCEPLPHPLGGSLPIKFGVADRSPHVGESKPQDQP